MVRTVTASELMRMLDKDPRPVVLDVRKRPAFEEDGSIIPGAVWKDPFEVGEWAREIAPGASVIIYCVHGHEVSNGIVDRLRSLGIDARLIEGGIEAWKAAGGATTSHAFAGERP